MPIDYCIFEHIVTVLLKAPTQMVQMEAPPYMGISPIFLYELFVLLFRCDGSQLSVVSVCPTFRTVDRQLNQRFRLAEPLSAVCTFQL